MFYDMMFYIYIYYIYTQKDEEGGTQGRTGSVASIQMSHTHTRLLFVQACDTPLFSDKRISTEFVKQHRLHRSCRGFARFYARFCMFV